VSDLRVIPLDGIPAVEAGDDLAVLLADATERAGGLEDGDVVVVDGQSRLTPGARVSVLRSAGDTARTRAVPTDSANGVIPVTPQ
jgi:hypothetical protein